MTQQDDIDPNKHPRENEERKLAIEEKKLDLEIRKLTVEQSKTRWMAISAIVAVGSALLTVLSGAYSLNKTTNLNFQTKLVEVALQDIPVSEQTIYRATVMAKMFPDYMPEGFQKRVSEIEKSGMDSGALRVGDFDGKKLLLELLDQSKNPQLSLKLFEKVFTADKWAHDLDPLMTNERTARR